MASTGRVAVVVIVVVALRVVGSHFVHTTNGIIPFVQRDSVARASDRACQNGTAFSRHALVSRIVRRPAVRLNALDRCCSQIYAIYAARRLLANNRIRWTSDEREMERDKKRHRQREKESVDKSKRASKAARARGASRSGSSRAGIDNRDIPGNGYRPPSDLQFTMRRYVNSL